MMCLNGMATKRTATREIKLYKETLAVQTDGDDDDDSVERITESQQELMEDYVEAEDTQESKLELHSSEGQNL